MSPSIPGCRVKAAVEFHHGNVIYTWTTGNQGGYRQWVDALALFIIVSMQRAARTLKPLTGEELQSSGKLSRHLWELWDTKGTPSWRQHSWQCRPMTCKLIASKTQQSPAPPFSKLVFRQRIDYYVMIRCNCIQDKRDSFIIDISHLHYKN